MDKISNEQCVPCRGDVPRLDASEIDSLKPTLPEWRILESDGILRLHRVFSFKTFGEALAFTLKVGQLAESEGHHPAILTEWGQVSISWWTHKIGGLHRNDFIMAAKTDAIYTSH